MLIFGWGHQTKKDYGPTFPMKCPNCNNNTYWHFVHYRVWFTLFFIPVIPYESKYYLLCEVCSKGIELQGQQIDKTKQLNQDTMDFLKGIIIEEQYRKILDKTYMLE